MMRNYFGVILISMLSLLIGCTPQGNDPAKMIESAKALDQQFLDAYNNRDVDALMDTYWNSPELVNYPPGILETVGWEATKDAIMEESANMPDFSLELTERNYKVAGEMVIGWGKWRMTITLPEGDPIAMEGRFTDVKAEKNSKWVYILDHASVPLPPPPPPENK